MTPKEERPRGLGRGLSALIGDEAVPTRGEAPKAGALAPVHGFEGGPKTPEPTGLDFNENER